jgi:hypothetical protein
MAFEALLQLIDFNRRRHYWGKKHRDREDQGVEYIFN